MTHLLGYSLDLGPALLVFPLLLVAVILFAVWLRRTMKREGDQERQQGELDRLVELLANDELVSARERFHDNAQAPGFDIKVAEAGLSRVRNEVQDEVGLRLVELAVELSPKNRSVLLTHARTLSFLNLHARAQKAATRLLTLDSRSIETRRILAASALGLDDLAEAKLQLEACLEQGDNLDVIADLAELHYLNGDLEEAQGLVSRALERLRVEGEGGAYWAGGGASAEDLYARMQELGDSVMAAIERSAETDRVT